MGNDLVHTPNLDRLASQSAVYPNGYVPMSVCRPSLVSLLTGLYPHQHGVHPTTIKTGGGTQSDTDENGTQGRCRADCQRGTGTMNDTGQYVPPEIIRTQ